MLFGFQDELKNSIRWVKLNMFLIYWGFQEFIWSFSADILQYVPDMWKENRPVGVGGAEGTMAPPQFDRSVITYQYPYLNQGTCYTHHITTCPPKCFGPSFGFGKDLRLSGRKLGAKSQLTVTNKLHSIFLPTDATYMYLSLWKNKVSFAVAAFHFPL